jgi:hypothetical protein
MLDSKGVLTFPADRGLPGWTPERLERAHRDLEAALEDLARERPISVSQDEAGTIRVYDPAKLN